MNEKEREREGKMRINNYLQLFVYYNTCSYKYFYKVIGAI